MKKDRKDYEIEQLFRCLRKEEERAVPSVREVLERERRPGILDLGSLFYRHRIAAVAVIAAVFLAPVVYRVSSPAEVPTPAEAIQLYDWESPTDFMLSLSEQPILTGSPTIEFDLWSEEDSEVIIDY